MTHVADLHATVQILERDTTTSVIHVLTAHGPKGSYTLCLEVPARAIAGRAPLAHCPCALVPGKALVAAPDLIRGKAQH